MATKFAQPKVVSLEESIQFPFAREAEMMLLAGIMFDSRAFDAVADFLKAEHFGDERHGVIFQTAARIIDKGQQPTGSVMAMALRTDNSLESLGGPGFIADLMRSHAGARDAVAWGRAILDAYQRRRALTLMLERLDDFQREDIDRPAIARLETLEADVAAIAAGAALEDGPVDFATGLDEAIRMAETAWKAGGAPTGVTTGLIDLDKATGGLHATDLIIIAGRPGMGKTALAQGIAKAAAQAELDKAAQEGYRPRAVVLFSLEMSRDQLAAREIAALSGVSTDRQRRGAFKIGDFQGMQEAARQLADLPIKIDHTAQASVAALRSRSRRIQRRHGLALIVVDYLQLLVGGRAENRVAEISGITRDLKRMAKELKVPVLALSQLSRQVEMRDDKRPQLADLRESGSIEQDADVIMFVYREQYYLEKAEPKRRETESEEKYLGRRADWEACMDKARGIAEVIIGKNRQGPVRTVELLFEAERTRFGNLHRGRDHE
jgi:replicative DNA helicase